MQFRITHETTYKYDSPARSITQLLRMQPRGHEGQFVVNWRVEVDRDCRLQRTSDELGNFVHAFSIGGPVDEITIAAIGEVVTEDTHGVVRQQIEPFPPTLFLRDTPLTQRSPSLRAFALEIAAGSDQPLGLLHDLSSAIKERMRFDPGQTDSRTTAMAAFDAGHGVCQDFAHIFIAAARHLGIPARYAGGYLFQSEREDQEAGHGWVEALVDGLGWVAFDPANGVSATDAYVRVAVGLDYLGAAPIRGAQHGGSGEELEVRVHVARTDLR